MSALDALRATRSIVGWIRFGSFARRNPVVVAVAVVVGLTYFGGPAVGALGIFGAVAVGVSLVLFGLQRRVMRHGLRMWNTGGSNGHRSGGSHLGVAPARRFAARPAAGRGTGDDVGPGVTG